MLAVERASESALVQDSNGDRRSFVNLNADSRRKRRASTAAVALVTATGRREWPIGLQDVCFTAANVLRNDEAPTLLYCEFKAQRSRTVTAQNSSIIINGALPRLLFSLSVSPFGQAAPALLPSRCASHDCVPIAINFIESNKNENKFIYIIVLFGRWLLLNYFYKFELFCCHRNRKRIRTTCTEERFLCKHGNYYNK